MVVLCEVESNGMVVYSVDKMMIGGYLAEIKRKDIGRSIFYFFNENKFGG